jgi:hypothetical protein
MHVLDYNSFLRCLPKLSIVAMLVISVAATWQTCVDAGEPNAKSLANELVLQLGHEEFAVRERAAARLVALEIDAMDALKVGRESPNREIRQRSTKLLATVGELDLQRRFAQFKQATDPTRDYGLPGWEDYRAIVGDTPAARSIFVLMHENEPRLLQWKTGNGQGLSKALHSRSEQLRSQAMFDRPRLELGSIAALMFVATRDDVQPTRMVQAVIYSACNGPRFQTAIKGGPNREVMAALTERWIEREPLSGIASAMYVGLSHDLKGSLLRAREVFDAKTTSVTDRSYACLCVAKFGDDTDIARLEKYLLDESICDQALVGGQVVSTKVQDIALFALLEVTGQESKGYGFTRQAVDAKNVIERSSLGFLDEERRAQAIAAWRTYRQNSPDKQ